MSGLPVLLVILTRSGLAGGAGDSPRSWIHSERELIAAKADRIAGPRGPRSVRDLAGPAV
eukprot:1151836-Pyramimonas_sp.AAC.1